MMQSFFTCSLPLTIASIGLLSSIAFSQSSNSQFRPTGGWRASSTSEASAVLHGASEKAPSSMTSPVYRAAYQADGGIGLPAFPGASMANPNANGYAANAQAPDQPRLVLPQNLPAMPNALSGAGAPTFPPAQQLPNYERTLPPPTGLDPQNGFGASATYNPQAQTVATGNELRAVAPTTSASGGNQLRPTNPTAQTGFGTNMQTQAIATGLPFVTPPPRTGNFPTSAYSGARFQTVAYQSAAQPVLNPANVAATQPVLPQNLNPNIIPTAYQQCAPGSGVIPTYPPPGAVPGTYVPPTYTPNLTPTTYSPNNSGYSPLFSLGQENYNVTIGRGIIGQPTVYVPGQPIRNFMRYLSP